VIRLTWLVAAWALAAYGAGLIASGGAKPIAGGDAFAAYRLRDGLIVALVAGLLAARYGTASGAVSAAWSAGGRLAWPLPSRVLTGVAAACGLVAAGVLALGGAGLPLWFGLSLWGIDSLAMVAALVWPGRVEAYPPPAYHWGVDAAGNWVRLALDEPESSRPRNSLSRRVQWALLALILVVGLGVRLWRLTTLPPTCVEMECTRALQLMDGTWPAAGGLDLYAGLAALLWRGLGDALAALRWASALLGLGWLVAVYWAARGVTRPAGSLVGLLLAALLPWAIWTARLGSEWSAASLLMALALGASVRGLATAGAPWARRWWGATGLALGLLMAQPIPLAGAVWLWLAGLALLAGADRDRGAYLEQVGTLLAAALAVGLPGWALAGPTAAETAAGLALAGGLLHSGGSVLDYFLNRPLLPTWLTGLTVVGLAVLVRSSVGRERGSPLGAAAAAVWTGGAALLVSWTLNPPAGMAADALLPLLPVVLLAASAAADELIAVFDHAWSSLIPLRRTLVVVTAALLIVVGREAWTLTRQLGGAGATAQNAAEAAMARYLADCLAGERPDDPCSRQGDAAPIFYAPPAVIDGSPLGATTRLLAGSALTAGRVLPLDPARDLLPAAAPAGDVYYLVGLDNQPVIDLLQQLYPTATLTAEPRDGEGGTLFLVVTITRAEALAHQGLAGQYVTASSGAVVTTTLDGPLSFAWQDAPPLEPPFFVEWEGSLLAPAAGAYTFALAGLDGETPPVVSLQLDGKLVLDTSLGLLEQRELLVEGYYRLTVRYRADAPPGDWAVTWTPPGGEPAPIPRAALYSPPLPTLGLIGTYYAGSTWTGPALTVRKDLILAADVDLPRPYSVAWTGKLAATRAGEYLFAVTANGPVILTLDGRDVLSYLPPEDLASDPAYGQAGLYLDAGWHDVTLRYAPAGRSDLRVLWTPPGSAPSLLMGRYLLPSLAEVTTADAPLPAAPELLDARLGDNTFALTTNLDFYQPTTSAPPSALPVLLSEPVWQSPQGCGADKTQLDSPRGATLDATGQRLYIADANNRRVVVLDADTGAPMDQVALPEFQEPVDVAFDANGTLLVLDAVAQAIYRVDGATGEVGSVSLAGFYRPRGLAVDATGNVLVADTGGARVAMLDALGSVIAQFGGPSSWLGQGQPVDVLAAANGSYWAIAADHGRLWRLDVLASVPAIERANTLTGPHLAGLPDGSFFVSDPSRRTVIYIAPNGQPYGQLTTPDALVSPTGVAATLRDGLVYVAVVDSATCRAGMWRVRPAR
jgi:sugar lactone lactonase YvrE